MAMALRAMCGRFVLMAFLLGLVLTGCSKPADPKEGSPSESENNSKTDGDKSNEARDPLHQSFAQAVRDANDPPSDATRPPDVTVTNKPTHKLNAEVVRLWDTIRFTTPDGKRIDYTATIETALGKIVIELHSDWAPNHVRNFVALAKAGYYDSLRFDRVYHAETPAAGGEPATSFDDIEAGCPLGTGETASGSIGYWLKPEFKVEPLHQEGAVGACRSTEADTAACRFYITLCKAPVLDNNYTVFGKVVEGLDVARKISMRPVIIDEQDVGNSRRPEKPVVIDKVMIQTREVAVPAETEGKH
jgi:cyclophilin family peptidyl-prolyl cis-trans isomerase